MECLILLLVIGRLLPQQEQQHQTRKREEAGRRSITNNMNNNKKDIFETIWICSNCGIVLFFRDDKEIHSQQTGHRHLITYDCETGKRIIEDKEISYMNN